MVLQDSDSLGLLVVLVVLAVLLEAFGDLIEDQNQDPDQHQSPDSQVALLD